MYINMKEFIDFCIAGTITIIVVIGGWLLLGGLALHFAEKFLH